VNRESFQTHCRFCLRLVEAATREEAVAKVEEHERGKDCPAYRGIEETVRTLGLVGDFRPVKEEK
jgi:hypothetical protein